MTVLSHNELVELWSMLLNFFEPSERNLKPLSLIDIERLSKVQSVVRPLSLNGMEVEKILSSLIQMNRLNKA